MYNCEKSMILKQSNIDYFISGYSLINFFYNYSIIKIKSGFVKIPIFNYFLKFLYKLSKFGCLIV